MRLCSGALSLFPMSRTARASPCTSLHLPVSPCISCTQVSLKAEGDAAATKLELRSKRFAGFTHALHDLHPQPAEKKRPQSPCVRACVCAQAHLLTMRGQGCREVQGGAGRCGEVRGGAVRHACPRFQLAQGCAALSAYAKLAQGRPGRPTLSHSLPPAGSCSSARMPTAPPTWPPTCNDRRGHGAPRVGLELQGIIQVHIQPHNHADYKGCRKCFYQEEFVCVLPRSV